MSGGSAARGVVTEGGNVRVRSVPSIRRRDPALGCSSHDRCGEAPSARAGAHMDPSGGKRGSWQPHSAGAQGTVGPSQVAASLPGHPIGHSSRSLRMISKILAAVANHTLRRAENGTRGLATSDRTDLTNETTARRIIELAKAGSTIRAGCAVARCGVSGAARIRRRPPFPSLPGSA